MENIFQAFSEDPYEVFGSWLDAARDAELNDPNAAALATADRHASPSVRMVLIKHFDKSGFRFFTNTLSQKGREIAENPKAALCFHWKSLRRQVRVEGIISPLDDEASDGYFHSRSRRSQVAAAVSRQSEPLAIRSELEEAFREAMIRYEGLEIPRPANWQGFVLKPVSIEFWTDGEDRLHHRILYKWIEQTWLRSLLYP